MKTTMTKASTKSSTKSLEKIATVAMLSAVSLVLYLLEFPVIPSLAHLKLDFSDVPALIGGLMFGPHWAAAIELIKNLIEMLIKGIGTQMGFGNIMNFIVGCAYTVPFCIVFKQMRKKQSVSQGAAIVLASLVGIISIVAVGIGGNYIIDPPFFKYFLGVELSSEALWTAIWGATALNAIKGAMLSVLSFPIILALLDRIKKILKM